MVKASSKYSNEVLRMADLMLDLDMTNKSKSELLDTLHNMENNDQRGYIELQSNIAAEQSDRYKMRREAKERDKKIKADKSGNPSFRDRPKYKPKSLLQKLKTNLSKIKEKEDKDKTKMVGGLSRKMNRGGLAKSGSADYRKKGLFY